MMDPCPVVKLEILKGGWAPLNAFNDNAQTIIYLVYKMWK